MMDALFKGENVTMVGISASGYSLLTKTQTSSLCNKRQKLSVFETMQGGS